jgi:hypothetical protein
VRSVLRPALFVPLIFLWWSFSIFIPTETAIAEPAIAGTPASPVTAAPTEAKTVSILFIGNSYTYSPTIGEFDDPAVPKFVQAIAESAQPGLTVRYSFYTMGGYSFEKHFRDPNSVAQFSRRYDKIVLQGQSIESLEMTPWMIGQGYKGLASFVEYLPKMLRLACAVSPEVTLYVNWGWNFKHPLLRDEHPGIHFPADHPRAGSKWSGRDKFEFQDRIEQSYAQQLSLWPKEQGLVRLSLVGRSWLLLQQSDLVAEDELYIADDWSHSSALGAFVAALVLARDVLAVDIAQSTFFPSGIDPKRALEIQSFLANAQSAAIGSDVQSSPSTKISTSGSKRYLETYVDQ